MSYPKPYKIDVPQVKIDSLKQKLAAAEFPDELQDANWDYGSPLADIKRLATTWENWDWRKAETKLNEAAQHFHVAVDVDGFETLDIHFVHQQSTVKGAIPLLFVHGWPGSFIEVLKLLPLLSQLDDNAPAFHVVAPSLPNFGFSQGVSKRGFSIAQYAETCHKLMLQLGYDEYVTQGGDWGFYITRAMGKLYPKNVRASHINMVRALAPKISSHPLLALQHSVTPYSEREKEGFKRNKWFWDEGRGYNLQMSTKPQTIAYALQDSPVALLAWIYEKLHDWTDSYPFTDDEILTWISIYQFSTAGPGAASRIYYESGHTKSSLTRESVQEYIGGGVKVGLTYNPKELYGVPLTWGRTLGNVVYEAVNNEAGHFYAYERPELLARDMKRMYGRGGGAARVVTGKDGYEGATLSRL